MLETPVVLTIRKLHSFAMRPSFQQASLPEPCLHPCESDAYHCYRGPFQLQALPELAQKRVLDHDCQLLATEGGCMPLKRLAIWHRHVNLQLSDYDCLQKCFIAVACSRPLRTATRRPSEVPHLLATIPRKSTASRTEQPFVACSSGTWRLKSPKHSQAQLKSSSHSHGLKVQILSLEAL